MQVDLSDDEMLTVLKGYGVASAHITFDGGDDSGQIEDITVKGLVEDEDVEKLKLKPEHVALLDTWQNKHTLYALIEAFAYVWVENPGFDWVTNEGGYGTIDVVPGEGTILVEMNIRMLLSEIEHWNKMVSYDYADIGVDDKSFIRVWHNKKTSIAREAGTYDVLLLHTDKHRTIDEWVNLDPIAAQAVLFHLTVTPESNNMVTEETRAPSQ